MRDPKKYIKYLSKAQEIIAPLCDSRLTSAIVASREIGDMLTRIKEKPEPLMVFVGSYSSGKSTIIKRLTKVDLATGVNPLTSEISEDILWNDLRIIDTPGLKSNQVQHDEKTLSFIGKADIVVWVVEADRLLLSEHQKAFLKVARDLLKADRMFIIINQMDTTGVNILDESEWDREKSIKTSELYRILNELGISVSIPISCVAADPDQIADGLNIDEAVKAWNAEPYFSKSHFQNFLNAFSAFFRLDNVKSNIDGTIDRAYEHLGYVKNDIYKIKTTFEKTNELISIKLNGLSQISRNASLRFRTVKANNKFELDKLFNSEFKTHINRVLKPEEFSKLSQILDENKINTVIEKFISESLEKIILEFDKYIDDLFAQEEHKINNLYLNKEIEDSIGIISKLFRDRSTDPNDAYRSVDFSFVNPNFIIENKDEISNFIKQGLGSLPKDSETCRNIV